jgi:hypothetical protein
MDDELQEELQFHIEMQERKNQCRESDTAEAKRQARLQFGSVVRATEECREQRGVSSIEILAKDLRYAIRTLRKSPGFTAVAIITLALGIGANTAIFSIVNSALLRPLSYSHPEQLYLVREILPQLAKFYPTVNANLPDFRIWQKQVHTFADVALAEATSADLTGTGEAESISGMRVSANILSLLGVRPALGRSFRPDEDESGQGRVVMLKNGDADEFVLARAIS